MNSYQPHMQMESLETRRLLSSAILSDNVLRIRAPKSGNNVIDAVLSPGGTVISVNVNHAFLGNFQVSDVNNVRLYAGIGDDLLEVTNTRRAWVTNTTMFAGPGDDTLIAGSGPDLMVGSTGLVHYELGLGMDSVVGGSGDCTVDGGTGHDLIYTGTGNDLIDGGERGSVIFGQGGNDTIVGGEHSNFICGGTGTDSINGGPGDNIIYGGGNRHTVIIPGGPHSTSTAGVMPGLAHYMIKLMPIFSYS